MDEGTANGWAVGRQLRWIRNSREKSLRVIAGLAGISAGHLCRIENGETALDSLSLISALANALQVAPTELIGHYHPGGVNGAAADATIDVVRAALAEVNLGHAGGQAQPVEVIRARVNALVSAGCQSQHELVGAALPALIRDMHASIGAGRDVAELLDLAVLLHTQGTVAWLRTVGAPLDLANQAAVLAGRAAQDRDTPDALGLATASTARVLIMAGLFDLARIELDSVTVSTGTPESMQLAGFRALRQSVLAAADSRPGDIEAPLEYAAELAERTGEGDAYYLAFGPLNVGLFDMAGALELGDHQRAVSIAGGLSLDAADTSRQTYYWINLGRALARVRGRRDDAVAALRRAEKLSAATHHRDPFVRDILAELVAVSKRDAVGRELRGMAYRAGLPV